MKPDNFNDVVEEGSSRKYIENLKQNVLLIYSPTSIEKNNIKNNQCLMVNWHDLTKKINKIDEFIKKNNTISSVVSYGGGSTIDIGKYIANKLGIDFICIPTMLSTNSCVRRSSYPALSKSTYILLKQQQRPVLLRYFHSSALLW